MNRIDSKYKSMAAYALYYQLQLKKVGTLDIIKQFIRLAVMQSAVRVFDASQLKDFVNHRLGLDVPYAVMERAVADCEFLRKKGRKNEYELAGEIEQEDIEESSKALDTNEERINGISEKLFKFIEEKSGLTLGESERFQVQCDLAHFLIDKESSDGFKPHIAAFIKENEGDEEMVGMLQEVSMGVLVFFGLQQDGIEKGWEKFSTPLTLFLDTEILFNIMGYNGEAYRLLAEDFITQVNEVKREAVYKNGKEKSNIRLVYFPETQEEVDKFFKNAESIKRGVGDAIRRTDALNHILLNCRDTAQIWLLNSEFWSKLSTVGIEMFDGEIPSPLDMPEYNVYAEEFIDKGKEEASEKSEIREDDQWQNLSFLDSIFKLRGRYNGRSKLEQVGYLMVSNTKDLLSKASKVRKSPPEGIDLRYPLALNLLDITSRMWLILNRGFGSSSSMTSLGVVTQASIALKGHLNGLIRDKYDEIFRKFQNKEIDEEGIKRGIYGLRKISESSNDPEDGILTEIITEDDIENYIRQKDRTEEALRVANSETNLKIDRITQESRRNEENLRSQLSEEKSKSENLSHRLGERDSMIERMKSEKIAEENKKLKEIYDESTEKWYKDLKFFIGKGKRKQWLNIAAALIVSAILVANVVLFISKDKAWYYIVVALVAGLILLGLNLAKHQWFVDCFKYLFSKRFREIKATEWEREFETNNPKPVRKYYTEEDWQREYSG